MATKNVAIELKYVKFVVVHSCYLKTSTLFSRCCLAEINNFDFPNLQTFVTGSLRDRLTFS